MNSPNWPWKAGEKLRFDRFMDLALHHPERGYYARRIRGVGKGGDFTTAPMVTPALGQAIAAWAAMALPRTACVNLIELGPGEGLLARAVLDDLPWWRRLRTRIHLVETSAPLRAKQERLLGSRVRWHASIHEALDACDGRVCIYSNEFVDAFPVRRFRREAEGWSELFLSPAEEWVPCEILPRSSVFQVPFPPGQVVEVTEAYDAWLETWLPNWKAGRMLTIDYGSKVDELYRRRPGGSLRAYLFQQRLEGSAAYGNPGRQDLTADVNFTDLQDWSLPWLETLSLRSQADFLRAHANLSCPADAQAIDPDGAGAAFMVLDQQRLAPRAD